MLVRGDAEMLIDLIKELYDASPANQDFLHTRLKVNEDDTSALKPYLDRITSQFKMTRCHGVKCHGGQVPSAFIAHFCRKGLRDLSRLCVHVGCKSRGRVWRDRIAHGSPCGESPARQAGPTRTPHRMDKKNPYWLSFANAPQATDNEECVESSAMHLYCMHLYCTCRNRRLKNSS